MKIYKRKEKTFEKILIQKILFFNPKDFIFQK